VNTQLDHLVVIAADLAQGTAWAEATLGATPVVGGKHALMGTHNRLLALGGWADAYLEIIALDPAAPAPGRARWFGIDELQAAVRETPRLVHWVARTTHLDMHRWGLVAAGFDPGRTLDAQRDGLRWRITVRDDGRTLAGGALPTLIEWQGRHPAASLPESGIALESLTLRGVPPQAADVLRLKRVDLQPLPGAAIEARLVTPRGSITLSSPT
jgi:hypothetical protein